MNHKLIYSVLLQGIMASLHSAALQVSDFHANIRRQNRVRSYSCGSSESEPSPPVSPTASKYACVYKQHLQLTHQVLDYPIFLSKAVGACWDWGCKNYRVFFLSKKCQSPLESVIVYSAKQYTIVYQ